MYALLPGQTATVRYKDQHFERIIRQLRQEPSGTHATLLALTGMPKFQMALAAQEVAARLGKTLHRVEPHADAKMHIGAPPRNLSRVIQSAAPAGSILYFDEADALFGRRTDVKAAADRFGQQDSNYSVESLSGHRGVVIGLFQAASEAELRKYRQRRVLVRFPPL